MEKGTLAVGKGKEGPDARKGGLPGVTTAKDL